VLAVKKFLKRNHIYKELQSDLGIKRKSSGNLTNWVDQGVLLLNSTLTVRDSQAASHQNKGWEEFTDAVIKALSDKKEHLVFILWGAYAQKKGIVIDESKHLVIRSPHPSPFSAYTGFFGSRPFSKCNNYLEVHKIEPVKW
jgi:uracil-DNA glycosylase